MKKSIIIAFTVVFGCALAIADDQTWTGKIGDSKCGVVHKSGEHGAAKMSDHDCVVGCVKGGAKYIFESKGKTYQIDNQDFSGLEEHAGQTVKVTGSMTGDTIHVSDIKGGKKT